MSLTKRIFLGSAPWFAFVLAFAPVAGAQNKAAAPAQAKAPAAVPAQDKDQGVVIEEVVARVNNDVITQSDLDHAAAQLREEVRQACNNCSAVEVEQKFQDSQKDLLRDLIDNSLLVQRAKDMGINEDTQVVKRLDDIRIENHIASLEELERQITASGEDFDDFKTNIRNQLMQQEVIRREVGAHIVLDHATVLKYYDDHKDEFVKPEQVVLREIFVSTAGKSDAEIAELRKKAEGLRMRVKDGEDFGELAKRFSDGMTASQGGDVGTFERPQMTPEMADKVFNLKRNEMTDVTPVKDGFLILQVKEHYDAGLQPEEKVEDDIQNKLYGEQMKPTLRTYLDTLRQDSYVQVKPGYVDTASTGENSIDEVAPTAEDDTATDKKSGGRKFLFIGKKKSPTPANNSTPPAAAPSNPQPPADNNANNSNNHDGA